MRYFVLFPMELQQALYAREVCVAESLLPLAQFDSQPVSSQAEERVERCLGMLSSEDMNPMTFSSHFYEEARKMVLKSRPESSELDLPRPVAHPKSKTQSRLTKRK